MNNKTTALGTVVLAKNTGRILLGKRRGASFAGAWGFFGGKMEAGDGFFGAALERELAEEIGGLPGLLETYALDDYESRDGRFKYASYLSLVKAEFEPQMNAEHGEYVWCKIGKYPKPLHPGAKAVLFDKENQQKMRYLRGLF